MTGMTRNLLWSPNFIFLRWICGGIELLGSVPANVCLVITQIFYVTFIHHKRYTEKQILTRMLPELSLKPEDLTNTRRHFLLPDLYYSSCRLLSDKLKLRYSQFRRFRSVMHCKAMWRVWYCERILKNAKNTPKVWMNFRHRQILIFFFVPEKPANVDKSSICAIQ